MHDDLEVIANLEFGKAVDRISLEAQERMRSVEAMPRGGQMEHARSKAELDQAEKKCRAYAQIWQDLLEVKNGGYLTRQDVTFIVQKVQAVVAASKGNLMNAPTRARAAFAAREITMGMDRVLSSIRRDLEIRIRKQRAFPKKENMSLPSQINVTIQSAANVNLGAQVGTINATLTSISNQGPAHHDVAAVLKELSEAVLHNEQITDLQKREALQVIADIVKQVEAKPKARSTGTLKAMLAGLPAVIGAAKDLSELWEKCAPAVKHFFGI